LINTAGNHFFFIIWIKKDEFFIWEGWGFKRCEILLATIFSSLSGLKKMSFSFGRGGGLKDVLL
jgi:hypothetical protein